MAKPQKTEAPPPVADPTHKLEIWQGGDLRSQNLGPAKGERLIGRFTGPGLYFLVGPNTGGKSHELDLIAHLNDEQRLRSELSVTDGEIEAYLSLGAYRIDFRRTPRGEIAEPRITGTETLPRIEVLPDPIDELITGGNLEGRDARLRHRLKNLLLYAPIESTEEIVDRLLGTAKARIWTDAIPEEIVAAWEELMPTVERRQKRFNRRDLVTAAGLRSEVLAQPRKGILDDHGLLVAELNAVGNAAEKAAAVQGEEVSRLEGELDGVERSAAQRLGDPADLRTRLQKAPELTEATAALDQAKERQRQADYDRRRRIEEEERRGKLRGTLGEKPEAGAEQARLDRAEATLAGARQKLADMDADLAKAKATVETAKERADARHGEVLKLTQRWAGSLDAVTKLFYGNGLWGGGGDEFTVPQPDKAAAAWDVAVGRWESLFPTVEAARSETVEAQRASATAVRLTNERAALAAAVDTAETERSEAKRAVETLTERVERWEESRRLVDEPVEGPTAEDLEAAAAAVKRAEGEREVAGAAEEWRRVAGELEEARRVLQWLEDAASDYRVAASESWIHLGNVVTEELSLPWLRVEGTEIKLVYDGSGTGAKLATSEDDAKDVRDLDDRKRISSAELREAMLKLMLSRRERLGGMLIVPWQIFAALDEERLHRFAGWSAEARLVTLSERPRREGDPEELHLERVEVRS